MSEKRRNLAILALVVALMVAAGFTDVRLRRDLGAIERVVSGVKS